MVLELSNYAPLKQAEEFTSIANMCRTTGDIVDVWDRSQLDPDKQKRAFGVGDIWNHHKLWAKFNRPGHWNMPCPLRVGVLGGWDLKPLRPTRLTPDEQYAHLSLWCIARKETETEAANAEGAFGAAACAAGAHLVRS